MSDWKIGDLAVCVDNSDQDCVFTAGHLLRIGASYTVMAIVPPARWVNDDEPTFGIVIRGTANPYTIDGDWHPSRFRKIRPDEHEACEPEFVTLLKRTKRTVRA